jgi:hypothetical protein
MAPAARVEGPVVLAAAVAFSRARLIDNRLATPAAGGAGREGGVTLSSFVKPVRQIFFHSENRQGRGAFLSFPA